MKAERPDSRLLAEVLHDDWNHGSMSELARAAAALARARRRRQRAALAGATLAGAVAIAVFSDFSRPTRVSPTIVTRSTVTFEIISDDELITQLSNQPLLVIPQKDGGKKIVLLDGETNS